MVGETGFEPATPCTQNKCATKLRHSPTGIIDMIGFSSKSIKHGAEGET
jgi:hypothetical protein